MPHTQFPIDLTVETSEEDRGYGTLFVLDAYGVLIRPNHGKYNHLPHHADHTTAIFELSNTGNTIHIVCGQPADEAHQLLDDIVDAFVDKMNQSFVGEGIVQFFEAGTLVRLQAYGDDDDNGDFTLEFDVHCGIAPEIAEEFLADLITKHSGDAPYVVVRPDSSSEFGFTAIAHTN